MGFLSRVVAEQKGASTVWERWIEMMDGAPSRKPARA